MPDEGHDQTRRFYEALGFLPQEETVAFWGPDNPTLVMVKVLTPNAYRPGPIHS